MKVIALLAQKGGTGKTTLAVHWAVEAQRRLEVALIDTDPQRSSAVWHQQRQSRLGIERPRCIPPESLQPVNEGRLAEALENCRADGVDMVFIDTAPHAERAAYAAATVADLVVIPTRASAFDLHAIGETVGIVNTVAAKAVIVVNALPPRGGAFDKAKYALEPYGLPLCPTPVIQRVDLANSAAETLGIAEFAPRGKAAKEIAQTWKWIQRQL